MRTGMVLPGAAVTPDPDAVAVGEIVGSREIDSGSESRRGLAQEAGALSARTPTVPALRPVGAVLE